MYQFLIHYNLLWQLKLVPNIFFLFFFLPKESTYKIFKNAFYLTKKVPFVLDIIKFLHFLLPLFFHMLTIAESKGETNWWQLLKIITSSCLINILRGKEDLVLKFGEWIEYYIRKTFMEKRCRKPRPFCNHLFGQHWATSLMGRQPHLLIVNHCT